MRFRCTLCGMEMHESLIIGRSVRLFKANELPIGAIRCPFCHKEGGLEVVQ